MNILIAPDSFKDCLSAMEVATALARGIRGVLPDAHCTLMPMADGGIARLPEAPLPSNQIYPSTHTSFD